MSNQDAILLTARGCLCSIGLNATQACTSMRSGITRFSEHIYYDTIPPDPEWDDEEPLVSSAVAVIDPYLDGPERLLSLAGPPLLEVIEASRLSRVHIPKTALLLALPQKDPVFDAWDLDQRFIPALLSRAGLTGLHETRIDRSGHTGMFRLIREAQDLLQQKQVDYCIVGGVDSYLLESRLEYLDENYRIRSNRNVDGYIPGEAAGFLLLERGGPSTTRGLEPMLRITGLGSAREEKPFPSQKNSSGKGLQDAISQVVNGVTVPWVVCDLNGESYRAMEWGLVYNRMGPVFEGLDRLDHPADCLGDVGAATGAFLLATTAFNMAEGRTPHSRALLWTSGDDGTREALTVERFQ